MASVSFHQFRMLSSRTTQCDQIAFGRSTYASVLLPYVKSFPLLQQERRATINTRAKDDEKMDYVQRTLKLTPLKEIHDRDSNAFSNQQNGQALA